MWKVFSRVTGVGLAMLLAGNAQADLVLSDAWLRAVPPVSPTMAGYVTVTNNGETPAIITGAHTEIAGHVMLHDMATQKDGTRKMRHLSRVEIPPGESVSFAPAGMHLMLMHLSRVPVEGESVSICIEQGPESAVCSDFQVSRTSPFDA